MKPSLAYDELKYILDNIRAPERLDRHPWTRSLVVRQWAANNDSSNQKTPGYHLIAAISSLFRQMMPSIPPKRGKRLDTSWCQFGMLAAEFFAPFLYGTTYPTSLRDAWGRIDYAVSFFVFGKSSHDQPEAEVSRYLLFADDTEPTPVSTLSDWHTRGLRRLADLFVASEQHMSQKLAQTSPILQPGGGDVNASAEKEEGELLPSDSSGRPNSSKTRRPRSRLSRYVRGVAAAILLVLLLLAGVKAFQIYRGAKTVMADLKQVQSLLQDKPGVEMLTQAGPLLSSSRQHLAALQSDVAPFYWMGKYLGWVPQYGGVLSQAEPLLDMANGLLVAGDEAVQGVAPLGDQVFDQEQSTQLTTLVELLRDAQPHLENADAALNTAITARGKLDPEKLSPRFRDLVVKIDPYLPTLQDGLTFALALPKLIGASDSGPQTYLILFQNEDELRATGGFLTSIGTVVVEDGKILSSNFEDSYNLDDLTKSYPPAPWQLDQYMAAHRLLIRDSNWSPDFPTSAALAEYLYAYTRFHTADGIIAVDQHAVQMLLRVLGPVTLQDASSPITSENVIGFMRSAKYDAGDQAYDASRRKDFIGDIGKAVLAKVSAAQGLPVESLAKALVQALNEKHILIQLDDPSAASVLAERGWDGAVRNDSGDFLMVVDSNIGFTKSNAVVTSGFVYQVDLSNPSSPLSSLEITQENNAVGDAPCVLKDSRSIRSYQDAINLCYWDYLRVYGPSGVQLLEASPHAVPGEATLDGAGVPARVDMLGEEAEGVNGFGTLLVVPIGDTLETSFQFLLPGSVLQMVSSQRYIYTLHVQKQPGTLANPYDVCIRLPDGFEVLNATPAGEFSENAWCLKGDLRTDLKVKLEFSVPSSWTPVPVSASTVTPFPSSTPAEISDTSQISPTATRVGLGYHGLDVPIGTDYQFIFHIVASGESLALYADRYGTTVEAIRAVNDNFPNLLRVGRIIIIPTNLTDFSGLPVFKVYQVHESISVENLAKQLSVDPTLLGYYNGLGSGELFLAEELVLVPR